MLSNLPLPPEYERAANARLDALRARLDPSHHSFLARLPDGFHRALVCSEFVSHCLTRRPELLCDLIASGDLLSTYADGAMRSRIEPRLRSAGDESALMRALRVARSREMVRIALRDLGGHASFEETVRDTSAFADALLDLSLARLSEWHAADLGTVMDANKRPQALVVLALGKLGAEELNFSSDIDLIFGFPEGGGYSQGGRRRLSTEEYFLRLARRYIQILSRPTEDGFVFRVDMRLRPFGASGPLVSSLNAIEEYYQMHGRDWERYALIRARPVAGDIERGWSLLETLRPFTYRRYLDFGALESLREMKGLISVEVSRKSMQSNIKLGPGGIREVEFIGQAFQMVRGGRIPALRDRQILRVLEKLGELGYLPPYAVEELGQAYRFLRTTEHRLQQVDDQQTHALPDSEVDRLRLAIGMGFDSWPIYARALEKHRARVQAHFDQVFGAEPAGDADDPTDELAAVWEGNLDSGTAIEALRQAGYEDGRAVLEQIEALKRAYPVRGMSERGRKRMARLIPVVLRAVAHRRPPFGTLRRVLGVIESIARRSVYLSLLIERPLGLSQLIKLCEASPFIAQQIARHPLLLDELLDARSLYAPLERGDLERELKIHLARGAEGDTEHEMDCLRQFKQASLLRVAAADVANVIQVRTVSDRLTEIAEVTLQEVLALAWRDLCHRHGAPHCTVAGERHVAPFAMIGYGKLGSGELGYGSDLDLVFLHGSIGEDQFTDGTHRIENSLFFLRLAQRIIHFLTTHTSAGLLYSTDARLRPSGSAGLLVIGLENFEQYQREQAWVWEHQALVRARPIAGDDALSERFRVARRALLLQCRDAVELRRAVSGMRSRMRNELSRSRPGEFDIKQDAGGIADIEFMVQYGVLHWPSKLQNFLEFTDNRHLVEGFVSTQIMSASDAAMLMEAYERYRERSHELALQERDAIVSEAEFAGEREQVSALWDRLIEAE